MGVNDAGKGNPVSLPMCRLTKQIVILTEKDSCQRCRAIHQLEITERGATILLCGNHIDVSSPQSLGYGPSHMNVHEERDGHVSFPIARSRCRPGESSDCARSLSNSSTCRWISASISA